MIQSVAMNNDNNPIKKSGTVILLGRPNAGKSTLLNALIGKKVSITSPKPQTTRFSIQAIYEDDRGQILFIDTPGIFAKTEDVLSKNINKRVNESIRSSIDVAIYLIDHTRYRDMEENKTFGLVRTLHCPKILVFNKSDICKPDYRIQYSFMEEEMEETIDVSALKRKHLDTLLSAIYRYLPNRPPIVDPNSIIHPAINIDSKLFIEELIREKAFIFLRNELPYSITTRVDSILERGNGTKVISARIITNNDRYKGMIVGHEGRMIKEISMATRKELETATNSTVFLELAVEVDPHWVDYI
jgi:GTP-binding protein Era